MEMELSIPKLTFASFCFPWAVAVVPGVKNLSLTAKSWRSTWAIVQQREIKMSC